MRRLFLCTTLAGLLFSPAVGQAQDKIDFEKEIYPFVKASCVQCHAPEHEYEVRGRMRTKKPKAGIILATKEGILSAEGESGTKILIPGDPDNSRMLQVTLLPLDDEMHFPPEGKAPQWTKAEKDLFAKWIEQGADFGDWTADPAPTDIPEWDGVEKE